MEYDKDQQYDNQEDNQGSSGLKFKFNVGTQEIREIVAVLNQEPFKESFTMVNFSF